MIDAYIHAIQSLMAAKCQRMMMERCARISDDPPLLFPAVAIKQKRGGSCHGCGSRETVIHNGNAICAYCRSDR